METQRTSSRSNEIDACADEECTVSRSTIVESRGDWVKSLAKSSLKNRRGFWPDWLVGRIKKTDNALVGPGQINWGDEVKLGHPSRAQ